MIDNCNNSFEKIAAYIAHLKDFHRVPTNYRFVCTFQKCTQVFSKFYPFDKHLQTHSRDIISIRSSVDRSNKSVRENSPLLEEIAPPSKIQKTTDTDKHKDHRLNEQINQFENHALLFTVGLHNKNNVTRKDVYDIQQSVTDYLIKVADTFESLNINITDCDTEFQFITLLSKVRSTFSNLDSDYKLFKCIHSKTGQELPRILSIENNKKKVISLLDSEVESDTSQNFLILMPIKAQIKCFFESNNVYAETINYLATLEASTDIHNFVNGTVWKDIKAKYDTDIVLPIWGYADEFWVNDAQGSHNNRHSVCGIYYNFPCLPPEYSSKLNTIFVAGMVRKNDLKTVGVNNLLSDLIAEFVSLEEDGLDLNINGEIVHVRFVMCLLQGDNLGVHQMLSFATGFNATFYCRFCRRPKELLKEDLIEFPDCMRRPEDYNDDIETANIRDTGISGYSIFNNLPSFHATINKSTDAMHDLFSTGIVKYGLTEVLNYCIYRKHYFDVGKFNTRKRELGKLSLDPELGRMPDITESYISKERKKTVSIRSSSSEMRSLCHFFPLIIGNLVPQNDKVWKYVHQLVELVEFILKRTFSSQDIDHLRSLIASHHNSYREIFNQDLKPKHHFVVHYPSVILSSGPIFNMMNFRNEAKHKGFKVYSHVMSCRRNICYTLCVKAYLQFTNSFLNQSFFVTDDKVNFKLVNLRLRNYFGILSQPLVIESDFNVMVANKIVYKGTTYKSNTFLTVFIESRLLLFEIVDIISLNATFYFVVQYWDVSSYNEHYMAYETRGSLPIVDIISVDFFTRPPIAIFCINNKFLFRIKNSFS